MAERQTQRKPADQERSRPRGGAGFLCVAATGLMLCSLHGAGAFAQAAPQVNTPPAGSSVAPTPQEPRAAPQAAIPSRPVNVRAGEHPTFTRIVFDWPEKVEYAASTEGRQARIRFASPSPVDIGRLQKFPPRWVGGIKAQNDGGGTLLTFEMPEGASLKTWRDGSKIVADISQPETGAKTEAAKPAPKPEAARETPKAAIARESPKSDAKTASTGKAPAAKQPAAPPAAAATGHAEAPKPAAAAKTAEPAHTEAPKNAEAMKAPAKAADVPAAMAGEQPAPQTAMAAPAPAAAMPAAGSIQKPAVNPLAGTGGIPAAAPVGMVQAAPLGTFMPAPPTGPVTGPPLVPSVDSSRTGPLLNFPWNRPVPAAAFLRNGNLWIVFDRPASVDLRPITTRDWGGAINGVEQLPVPGMTVLRLAVPSGTTASFVRRNAGWQIGINTIQPDQLVPKESAAAPTEGAAVTDQKNGIQEIDVRRQLDADGGAKLFFAANDPAQPLSVPDPDTGEILTIVPFTGSNAGVPARRDFIELSVLPSYQGLAIEPRNDNLEIKRYPRGIEIGTPNGLALSSPRGANPKSGSTEILRYDDWRKVPGETFVEQKDNLEYRLSMSTPGQRQASRLALAEFLAAHDMMPETLGVLARARAEQPDLERDKLYRALRGIANLRIGRLNEASEDLDSKIFDDDPDILAYRGMLAAERDDWPAARRSFSLAGAAVAKFPADLRTPIRLEMARAWLAGGDIAAATAELRALGDDELTPGEAAEGNYVRGLLAEATNRPEDAIRLFDQASGSGDRKARALAEFAKTDLLLSRKLINNEQAIEQLDKLKFAWRGGPYEFNLLRRLGELQFSVGDLRGGITTFRQLVKYFPKSPEVPLLTKQMSDEFAKLFLDGGAQSLPPLTALALYYDYRELTPPGPEGDEIISKLADRLVSVDLLNRAAELIEHQLNFRLRGDARTRAGARLAVVYLLDRNPEAALKALQNTESSTVPPSVTHERRLLQARALADLDRYAEALGLLGQDQSPEAMNLRADINWRARDWVAFARVASQILGNRYADPAPLSPEERNRVLKLAVAYSLGNDTASLVDLRRKYGDKFRDTPDEATFTAVASTVTKEAGDPRELAAAIAQIGQYEAFMSGYRDRVAKGGLSAIN